jgi:hypothetical protein
LLEAIAARPGLLTSKLWFAKGSANKIAYLNFR